MSLRKETIGECTLYLGDCREIMAGELGEASVHAVVTDPPYGLSKQPDMAEVLGHWLAGDDHEATGGGFMGKAWDSFVPGPLTWEAAARALKPGGHLAAFASSRTYDLMAVSIRLAAFEIRDQLMWLYGSGFPKSHDVAKAIDKAGGVWRGRAGPALEGDQKRAMGQHYARSPKGEAVFDDAKRWEGWGTALKPAHEPIVLARRPFRGTVAGNVLAHGTGAINTAGCVVPMSESLTFLRPPVSASTDRNAPQTNRSDLPFLYENSVGRWPANVLHDGSIEVLEGFGMRNLAASRFFYTPKADKADREFGLDDARKYSGADLLGRKEGSAGLKSPRAGAGKNGGRANHHPTVKPTDLMRWLCRLLTPPGGTILDPFMGSGSTGVGAVREGFRFIGVEQDPGYFDIACRRVEAAVLQVDREPDLVRQIIIATARMRDQRAKQAELFA